MYVQIYLVPFNPLSAGTSSNGLYITVHADYDQDPILRTIRQRRDTNSFNVFDDFSANDSEAKIDPMDDNDFKFHDPVKTLGNTELDTDPHYDGFPWDCEDNTTQLEEDENKHFQDNTYRKTKKKGNSIISAAFYFEPVLSPMTWHHSCLSYDHTTKQVRNESHCNK